MLKRIVLLAVLLSAILTIMGCQTVQGLGDDIKWTGEKGAEILE